MSLSYAAKLSYGRSKKGPWAFGALFLLSIASCFAGSITYQLVGVTFEDGGTASGEFTYNLATNALTSVDITTSAGSSSLGLLGSTYISSYPGPYECCGFAFITDPSLPNLSGAQAFSIGTVQMLSSDGGTYQIQGFEGFCIDAGCMAAEEARLITSGEITNVPEPSAALLWGGGFIIALISSKYRLLVWPRFAGFPPWVAGSRLDEPSQARSCLATIRD